MCLIVIFLKFCFLMCELYPVHWITVSLNPLHYVINSSGFQSTTGLLICTTKENSLPYWRVLLYSVQKVWCNTKILKSLGGFSSLLGTKCFNKQGFFFCESGSKCHRYVSGMVLHSVKGVCECICVCVPVIGFCFMDLLAEC